jgi:CsoR family transcriptional regulator, copper-sensing transcriptional repressor
VEDAARVQVLKRLSYVTGHLQGIAKMTQADRYCVEILKQSYAVRAALQKIDEIILESHLRTCVVHQAREGKDCARLTDELIELYSQAKSRP